MFTIKADNAIIYNPTVEETVITSGTLTQAVNEASTFEFAIPPSHIAYNALQKMATEIKVYDRQKLLFRGRILNEQTGLWKQKKFTCEGELAFLKDSVLRPYSWESGSICEYLQMLIINHNSQVEAEKQFTLRKCEVSNSTNNIVRSNIEYTTTWDELKAKLLDNAGASGYLYVVRDEQAGITYLDYLEDSPYMSGQKIKLGENITDLTIETKGEELATAIIPLGAKLQDEEGNETDERLTIAELNDGLDYISDADAIAKYGLIFKTIVHESLTITQNLLDAGEADLAYAINPIHSLTITAVDLKKAGVDTTDIRFFEYVFIDSEPHGLSGKMLINKLTTDLLNPANNIISMGSDYGTFTQNNRKGISDIIDSQVSAEMSEQKVGIFNQIVNLRTAIALLPDSIMSTVSAEYITTENFNTTIQNIDTKLTQTNNEFIFEFNNLLQKITSIGDGTENEFVEIKKYIRFDNGDIVLGEIGNPNEMRIKNDRISFLQSGQEVAYINENKLYITVAQIKEQLNIGKFAFYPRANENLTFNKKG